MIRVSTTALAIALFCGALPAGSVRGQERATSAPAGLIVGKVVDSDGAPVGGAQIRFNGPAGWFTSSDGTSFYRQLIASPEGEFYFTGLPRGEYGISASKEGYEEGYYGRRRPEGNFDTLTLREGERRVDVRITVWKHAVVTGMATDDAGEPIQGSIQAFRRSVVSGHPVFEPAGGKGGGVDDRGQYRLFDLAPDDYIFVFTGRSDGLTYPPTCRPGPSANGALELITLAAGAELSGVDFRVAPVKTVRVTGVLNGGAHSTLHLVPARTTAAPSPCQPQEATTSTIGGERFTFPTVQPGRYELQVAQPPLLQQQTAPDPQTVIQTPTGTMTMYGGQPEVTPAVPPNEPALWASVPITVGAKDIDDITLTLQQGPRVSGRVEFDVSPSPPTAEQIRRRAQFQLELADGSIPWLSYPQVRIAGGRVAISGVLPGRYVIQGTYDKWSVRSVTIRGRDVTGVPFDIGPSDVNDLVVVFTDRTTTISGIASVDGRTDTDVRVLIFPADPRFWVDYGRTSPPPRRMTRTGTGIGDGGQYSADVLPGDYCVVATSSDVPQRWTDPEYLKRLAAVAERVSVREGDQITLNLRSKAIR